MDCFLCFGSGAARVLCPGVDGRDFVVLDGFIICDGALTFSVDLFWEGVNGAIGPFEEMGFNSSFFGIGAAFDDGFIDAIDGVLEELRLE